MNADPEIRKEVFAWFGGAGYAAQCFEVELCTLLLLVRRLKDPSATRQHLEDLDTKLSKRNLGTLLRELAKHLTIRPDFQAMLDGYLDRRNYLMHRFFFDHASDLLSAAGCQKMISELKGIHASLNEADQIAQAMSANIRKALGMSEDQVQALVSTELHWMTND
jgi:hypothetical protein